MLSYDYLRDLLREFSYKPGWRLSLHEDRHEGNVLIVETTMPDSSHPEKDIDLRIVTFVPPVRTDGDFADWLLYRLCRIETHECREWLKWKGVTYSNPHADER